MPPSKVSSARSAAKKKVVARAVGGSYRRRVLPKQGSSSFPSLTRNDLLDCIAAEYQRLGKQQLKAMNNLRGMRGDLLQRELTGNTILQPALNVLAAIGIRPQDDTIGSFMRATRLSAKDIRWAVTFPGEDMVWARRVGGRFRGRKHAS